MCIGFHQESFVVPHWVEDLDTFRRWARSAEFPESGKISYFKGDLGVDLSMETMAHNQLKGEYNTVLGALTKKERRGRYFHDRMMLVHEDAGLSTEPDGMFVSHVAMETGRIRIEQGDDSLELIGSPDMTLEIVSRFSVRKDKVVLRELYWEAQVPEYWLVDSRGEQATFEILRRTPKGYVGVRKQQGGWLKSAVFGKSFRLTQETDRRGNAEFTLAVR